VGKDHHGMGLPSARVGSPGGRLLLGGPVQVWPGQPYPLGATYDGVGTNFSLFDLIQVDPVVGQVKLIAEPWDLGEGGYQVGDFPVLWSEWNGRYRDTVRDYWRGADRTLGWSPRMRTPSGT